MSSWLGAHLSAPAKTQRSKASRRSRMRTSKSNSWIFCVAATVTIAAAFSSRLAGQTAAVKSSGESGSSTQWSVQMERIDPGDLGLAHSFQIAIYENLLE